MASVTHSDNAARKRVWIINHYAIPPQYGGLCRHFYFSRYLREQGYDVDIFTASKVHNTTVNFITDKHTDMVVKEFDGVPYTYLRVADYRGNGLSRIRNMLEFPWRVWRCLRKRQPRPDVIYTSAPSIFGSVAAAWLAKRFRVPLIVEIRDLWPESIVAYKGLSRRNPLIWALYRLEKWLYTRANRLIFTAPGGKDYIRERGWENKVSLDKIFNINNGVDLREFDAYRETEVLEDAVLTDPEVFTVVYCGSIRLVNGVGMLVDCARIVQKSCGQNIQFLCFGEGNERALLEQMAREKHIDNIHFRGHVHKKYIPYIVSHSDLNVILVQPTALGRFGCSWNKLFDYCASGRPILSNCPVKNDLIVLSQAGETVEEATAQKLADAVMRFYRMPAEEREAMGDNARRAARDYDFTVLAQRVRELIDDVTTA